MSAVAKKLEFSHPLMSKFLEFDRGEFDAFPQKICKHIKDVVRLTLDS